MHFKIDDWHIQKCLELVVYEQAYNFWFICQVFAFVQSTAAPEKER